LRNWRLTVEGKAARVQNHHDVLVCKLLAINAFQLARLSTYACAVLLERCWTFEHNFADIYTELGGVNASIATRTPTHAILTTLSSDFDCAEVEPLIDCICDNTDRASCNAFCDTLYALRCG
jgi:hypothetical protein